MEAAITAAYLDSLVDVETPVVGSLDVVCSEVEIGTDGVKLLDVVNRLLDAAPKLPVAKRKRPKATGEQNRKRKMVAVVGSG